MQATTKPRAVVRVHWQLLRALQYGDEMPYELRARARPCGTTTTIANGCCCCVAGIGDTAYRCVITTTGILDITCVVAVVIIVVTDCSGV